MAISGVIARLVSQRSVARLVGAVVTVPCGTMGAVLLDSVMGLFLGTVIAGYVAGVMVRGKAR